MKARHSLQLVILSLVALVGGPMTAMAAEGPITVDPEHPHSFRYQSGEHFFPMGDTAYYLIAQPTNVIARYINIRREHDFNFVRVMAMADGCWPFGGTVKAPDYTVIDETVMRKWDWVFDYAAARGMNIELILWGYGVAGGEGLWASQTRQDFWIRTLVNRFKHRPNLFMWTIANEFERYPDGKYQYHPDDVDWARGVSARIRQLDAVHPIGCHPSVWITDQDLAKDGLRPFATYHGFTQRRPPVVWPLWEGSAVNLNVTQNNEGVQPRTWGDFGGARRGLTYSPIRWKEVYHPAEWTATGWTFAAAGLEDCVAEDRAHGKPVLNTEFGYQHEPGYESEMNHASRQCHQPATVRRKAWKIATAGGYFAAGFESTAVRNFTGTDVANFRPEHLKVLHDFFAALPYWRMQPFAGLTGDAVALAESGGTYVAYLPHGGATTLDLTGARSAFTARWFNPRNGQFGKVIVVGEAEKPQFNTPDAEDWTLLVATARPE